MYLFSREVIPALLRTDDEEVEEAPAADVDVGATVGDDDKTKG